MEKWVLGGGKFLTDEEIARLKQACRTEKEKLIINLGLLAGLRIKEIAELKCGDVYMGNGLSTLTVRHGKGGKARVVGFNGELKAAVMEYLKDKVVNADDPLLPGKGGKHLAKRTVQRVFERRARMAGITGHCFHHLRHTYASHLYKASEYNLRLVQKQLGHSDIRTTQVYADVFDEDLAKALEKLYHENTK